MKTKTASHDMTWLLKANIIAMSSCIRSRQPDYPVITANMLEGWSPSELRDITDQLESMLRSLGQVE